MIDTLIYPWGSSNEKGYLCPVKSRRKQKVSKKDLTNFQPIKLLLCMYQKAYPINLSVSCLIRALLSFIDGIIILLRIEFFFIIIIVIMFRTQFPFSLWLMLMKSNVTTCIHQHETSDTLYFSFSFTNAWMSQHTANEVTHKTIFSIVTWKATGSELKKENNK